MPRRRGTVRIPAFPGDDASQPLPPPPSHEPPQNLNPSSYYCLSKKNTAGSLSYTISQDCTDGQLVRRKRLCAFDGPASSKKHHALDSRSSPLFELGDSSEGGNDSSECRSVAESDDDGGLTIEYPPDPFLLEHLDPLPSGWGFPSDLDKEANQERHSKAFRNTPKMASFSQANDESFRQSSLVARRPLQRPVVHDRPWKCPVTTCKFHEYGWPTAKEMERHHSDKHPDKPTMYKCLFDPCPYKSKRESNCKQHMEKAHGWTYVRSKREVKQRNATKVEDVEWPTIAFEPTPEPHPGEDLRFSWPSHFLPLYPGGLKATPGLEALASRRGTRKPTSGVLNLASQYTPHQTRLHALARHDAPQTEVHTAKGHRLDPSDPLLAPYSSYSDSPARQADHGKPLLSGQPGELGHTTSLRHLYKTGTSLGITDSEELWDPKHWILDGVPDFSNPFDLEKGKERLRVLGGPKISTKTPYRAGLELRPGLMPRDTPAASGIITINRREGQHWDTFHDSKMKNETISQLE